MHTEQFRVHVHCRPHVFLFSTPHYCRHYRETTHYDGGFVEAEASLSRPQVRLTWIASNAACTGVRVSISGRLIRRHSSACVTALLSTIPARRHVKIRTCSRPVHLLGTKAVRWIKNKKYDRIYRQTDRETDRQTDTQSERQTDKEKNRQTDRQTAPSYIVAGIHLPIPEGWKAELA